MSLRVTHSPHTVSATIDRGRAAIESRGITVFARIDHAGGARAVGLELADEEVLIFGDPKAGTLLMQDDPAIGYELPLRLLAWSTPDGTMVGFRAPTELAADYAVGDRVELLRRMEGLLEQLVAESVAP
jgi:uncharacterized protein (DUF302 family)